MNSGKFEHVNSGSVDKYLGQFRATDLWYKIIAHLRQNAAVGRHRYLIWQYDDVFSGENAVNIVSDFLKQNQSSFPNEVSRNNAIKVCQCLMTHKIFESANRQQRFEATSASFYRFKKEKSRIMGVPTSELDEEFNKENLLRFRLQVPADDDGAYHNPNYDSDSPRLERNAHRVTVKKRSASMDTSTVMPPKEDTLSLNSLKQRSRFCRSSGVRRRHTFLSDPKGVDAVLPLQKKMSSLYRNSIIRKSLTRMKPLVPRSATVLLNSAVVAHAQRSPDVVHVPQATRSYEALLSHLLSLVHVPVLEAILSVPDDLPRLTPTGDSIAAAGELHSGLRIPWLDAATKCMNRAPVGANRLWSGQSCKLHCYRSVLDHYRRLPSCLLPSGFFQLYSAVVEFVRFGKPRKARDVLRLLVKVLPPKRARQVEPLVRFLKMASDDIFINLDKNLSNREVVLRDFADALLLHPLLSAESRTSFFDFFLTHSAHVFQDPTPSLTQRPVSFCLHVSVEVAAEQSRKCTERALKKLLSSIKTTSSFSNKERKSWLRKFGRYHSHLT